MLKSQVEVYYIYTHTFNNTDPKISNTTINNKPKTKVVKRFAISIKAFGN